MLETDLEKKLNAYRAQGLPIDKLRVVLDTLYDGDAGAMGYLLRIRQFYCKKDNIAREHQVYLWLVRNGLTGNSLTQFFENEGSFLDGMNTLINRLDGRRYSKNEIKIDEAL